MLLWTKTKFTERIRTVLTEKDVDEEIITKIIYKTNQYLSSRENHWNKETIYSLEIKGGYLGVMDFSDLLRFIINGDDEILFYSDDLKISANKQSWRPGSWVATYFKEQNTLMISISE